MKNMRTLILLISIILTSSVKAEVGFSYTGEWEGANTTSVGITYSYFLLNDDRTGVFLFGLSGDDEPYVEKFGAKNIKEHDGFIEIDLPSSPSGFSHKLIIMHSNVGVGIKINHITYSLKGNEVTSKGLLEYSLERKRSPSLSGVMSNMNKIVNKTMKKDAAK